MYEWLTHPEVYSRYNFGLATSSTSSPVLPLRPDSTWPRHPSPRGQKDAQRSTAEIRNSRDQAPRGQKDAQRSTAEIRNSRDQAPRGLRVAPVPPSRPTHIGNLGDKTIEVPELVPMNLQKAILTIFTEVRKLQDDAHSFAAKAAITLGPDMSHQLLAPRNWFCELKSDMIGSKYFLRVCWLKAIGGGWTTTCRMHENIKWPCIFGCEANDEIAHYFVCPVLWHIACSQTSFEESIYVSERLCFVQPSLEKLKRLALAHSIYHACKFDTEIISLLNLFVTLPDTIPPWRRIQDLALGYSRTFKHIVN